MSTVENSSSGGGGDRNGDGSQSQILQPVVIFDKKVSPPVSPSPKTSRPPALPAHGLTTPPQNPEYIYEEDAGIIRCICGFDDDDGFTIQCEKCNAWQHAQCVDILEDEVPDVYYCDQCSDRKVNVEAAIERQTKRLQLLDSDLQQQLQPEPHRQQANKRKSSKSKARTNNSNNNSNTNISSSNNNETPNRIEETNDRDGSVGSSGSSVKRVRSRRVVSDAATKQGEEELDKAGKFNNASYQSFFVKIDACQVPDELERYMKSQMSLLDEKDESYSFLSQQEFAHINPANVFVCMTSSNLMYENGKGLVLNNNNNRYGRFGLFIDSNVPTDRLLIEFKGKMMFQQEYKQNPINQYRYYGCPKPGVLFQDATGLSIAIDGRYIGTEASFIRPSCKPNVKFSPIIIKGTNSMHFAGFAMEPIKSGSELTVDWNWDSHHPVHKIIANNQNELSESEAKFLLTVVDMISQRGIECGCNAPQDCILTRMKKVAEELTSSNSSGNNSISNTPDEMIYYSAREERKLQGAMSLIEKLEKQHDSKKRKRHQSVEDEEVQSNSTLRSRSSSISSSAKDQMSQNELSPTTMALPNLPAKRLYVTPSKKLLKRYLMQKHYHLSTSTTSSPPLSASSSPKIPSDMPMSPVNSEPPSRQSPELLHQQLPVVVNESKVKLAQFRVQIPTSDDMSVITPRSSSYSGQVFESMMTVNSTTTTPITPLTGVMPTQPAQPAPLSQPQPPTSTPATPVTAKPLVKKLSFADYKKKQKPK